ncbi:MAG TPA: amylo-alpha-1,6-glucosidase [Clostridiales bacterium]|nr:amylo-alpha-1,6-glucosidase [Clostridiales bacterium]
MEFGKGDWRSFERGIEKEWLLTNGIGGYASSTIIGANTRRYHGLLVAALNPPVERHLALAKIDESITIGENRDYNLYSFKTSNGYIMKGYKHQQRFISSPLPEFIYSVEDVIIEKKVTMVYGENTTAIVYRIINGCRPLKLRFAPLVNFRDYHHNSSRWHMNFKTNVIENGAIITPYNLETKLSLVSDKGIFKTMDDCWFLNMYYPVEEERGLSAGEDHFIPGYFYVEAQPGEEKYVTIIATVEKEAKYIKDIKERNALTLIEREKGRIDRLVARAGYKDEFRKSLVIAADQFIVSRKSTNSKTIIAGYPWFTDWGRDTMIALPGITLATGRFDDAREILGTFAEYAKDGIIPNMFPDGGQPPAYNTVDASLWYFEAVNKFIEYTEDYAFVKDKLYKTLKDIINSYINGTHLIKMDADCLLNAGNPYTQLTWMDAMAGGRAVTPRYGKPVEINALWYNAFKIMSNLAAEFGNEKEKEYYENQADRIRASFVAKFWNEAGQCLYDVVNEDFMDDKIRPNQIMAVSLSYPVVERDMAVKIVKKVLEELYTAYGIRSLSPKSKEYKGIYIGNPYERDSAYHQGTAWSWLSGQFITAMINAYEGSSEILEKAKLLIWPFKDHIRDGCIGSISEIFDGDDTGIPRGCFAQAWSVGEVLRAYSELVR